MTESELWLLIDELKESKQAIMNLCFEIRDFSTPSNDVRRRVESVSQEIFSIAYDRAVQDEGEFDEEQEKRRLH